MSAACANSTNPLSQTACLAICSLQCLSHSSSCWSRGEKTCATGLTVVVASFQGQRPDAALDGIVLLILVVHLAPTLWAPRAGRRSLRLLLVNQCERHLLAQLFAQFQDDVFDLCQVRLRRLLIPIQQFINQDFGSAH